MTTILCTFGKMIMYVSLFGVCFSLPFYCLLSICYRKSEETLGKSFLSVHKYPMSIVKYLFQQSVMSQIYCFFLEFHLVIIMQSLQVIFCLNSPGVVESIIFFQTFDIFYFHKSCIFSMDNGYTDLIPAMLFYTFC